MQLHLIAAAAAEPVTLAEAVDALHLAAGPEDSFVLARIAAARSLLSGPEGYTKRQLVTASWRMDLPEFPTSGRPIVLPLPPLRSITKIEYVDPDGVLQTWDAAKYQVVRTLPTPDGTYPEDCPRATVQPAYGESYPGTRAVPDAVRITFECGYGAPEAVPAIFKTGILLVVGELYKNREETISGTIIADVPLAARSLLFNLRDRERGEEDVP